MSRLNVDIESRSLVNINVGVYNYAIHPSTEILCIAFKIDGKVTKCITPGGNRDYLTKGDFSKNSADFAETMEFVKKYMDQDCTLYAFNESFERIMLGYCAGPKLGFPSIKFTRWMCTQAQALYYNLPNDLMTVSNVLPTEHKKMEDGHRVMLQLCKPRDAKKGTWWTREEFPEKYELLYEYCIGDVEAEYDISIHLGPLPDFEIQLFNLDKEINNTGLPIDMKAVSKARAVDAEYRAELVEIFVNKSAAYYKRKLKMFVELCEGSVSEDEYNEQLVILQTLAQGLKPTQREKVQNYFNERYDQNLTSMAAEVVDKLLANDFLDEDFRADLILRGQTGKASVAKVNSVVKVMTPDNRFHGGLQYYGASGSGRWAGRTFQPHNLPRGYDKPEANVIFNDLRDLSRNQFIEKYREEGVMTALSGIIRGFIVPPKGNKMFAIDYSGIEARIAAWLGDVQEDLTAFRAGLCAYREFAKIVFGYSHEKAHALDKKSSERAVCKEGILSLGYGVGHDKYGSQVYKLTNGDVDIRCDAKTHKKLCPPDPGNPKYSLHSCESKRIVKLYRESRPRIVQLWYDMESAVFSAMKEPGTICTAGLFKFIKKGMFLHMRLPNGRVLRFPNAEVVERVKWGKKMPTFIYRGERTGKKTWEEMNDENYNGKWRVKEMYGAKFFQYGCQAIARDIMAEAMLRVQRFKANDKQVYSINLTVHDEIVGFYDEDGPGNLEEIEEMMIIVPDWCPGVPLAVEGELLERYGK